MSSEAEHAIIIISVTAVKYLTCCVGVCTVGWCRAGFINLFHHCIVFWPPPACGQSEGRKRERMKDRQREQIKSK